MARIGASAKAQPFEDEVLEKLIEFIIRTSNRRLDLECETTSRGFKVKVRSEGRTKMRHRW